MVATETAALNDHIKGQHVSGGVHDVNFHACSWLGCTGDVNDFIRGGRCAIDFYRVPDSVTRLLTVGKEYKIENWYSKGHLGLG